MAGMGIVKSTNFFLMVGQGVHQLYKILCIRKTEVTIGSHILCSTT